MHDFAQNQKPEPRCNRLLLLPKASWLAYDRPGVALDRSSCKLYGRGLPDTTELSGSAAASRQIVGKPTPTGFAQNQKTIPRRNPLLPKA
jgi:hypothetical protein